MEPLHIPQTDTTPLVNFDPEGHVLMLEGKMIPEDVEDFYNPVAAWIDKYFEKGNELILRFRLYYYNTSSYKRIYNLCKKLGQYAGSGKKVLVRWEYEEGDEDSRYDAEEILDNSKCPYELVEVSE